MIGLLVRASPPDKVLIANVSCSVVFIIPATSVFMYKRREDAMLASSKEPTNLFLEELEKTGILLNSGSEQSS